MAEVLRCASHPRRELLDLNIAYLAPAGPALTVYNREHMITYTRVLDPDNHGADWRDVSQTVLHIDADRE